MVYSFADFFVEYDSTYPRFKRLCKDYECVGKPDVSFTVTEEEIEAEREFDEFNSGKGALEMTALQRKLAGWMPMRNALVFHSALIDVEGTGVAFCAHSGTGKSTHMFLWKKLLGDKVTVVNGDKPFIRFFENEPYPFGYGSPWNGKENLDTNTKTPLKHLCFLERDANNSCEKIGNEEALDYIFDQIFMPSDPQQIIYVLSLADKLLQQCSLWKIKCNMDIDAAKVAYETIFNVKEEN